MNYCLGDKIKERYEKLTVLISYLEDKIKEYPEGMIYSKQIGKAVYYYRYRNGTDGEQIISKDNKRLIDDLLQKSYYDKVLKAANKEKKSIKSAISSYPDLVVEDVYDQLPENCKKRVIPLIPTDEQFVAKWSAKPYKYKTISDNVPVFETMNGERVRSKSEMIIADHLYINKIPYKYECPLQIGNEIIHPDFTVLRVSDRKILYLEHCGMIGDKDYADNMVERNTKYSLAGILLGDNLFYTFESANQPFDVRVLDNLINTVFK